MGWRKITKNDCVRGTLIRFAKMEDSYNVATIVGVSDNAIHIARPYAYARVHFNSKDALLGAECFSIGINNAVDSNSDIEVYEGAAGNRMMVT